MKQTYEEALNQIEKSTVDENLLSMFYDIEEERREAIAKSRRLYMSNLRKAEPGTTQYAALEKVKQRSKEHKAKMRAARKLLKMQKVKARVIKKMPKGRDHKRRVIAELVEKNGLKDLPAK